MKRIFNDASLQTKVVYTIAATWFALVAQGQQLPLSQMYVPPAQRVVRVMIENGVLMSRGSVTGSDHRAPVPAEARQLFVVDSAALSTIVDANLAHDLGGKGVAGERLEDKTLALAGAEISHRPVLVFPLTSWERQTGERLSGIAGAELFSRLAARIDYVNQQLTLVVPQSCATTPDSISLRVIGGLPFVEATIGTVRGLFLVDTGQGGSGLILTSEFLAAHPDIASVHAGATLPTFDDQGAAMTAKYVRVGTLGLGKYSLTNVVASIAPPAKGGAGAKLAGVIGGGVLSRFDVLMDVPQASMTLTPNAYYAAPFEADMSGLLLLRGDSSERRGEQTYTVAAIAEKSPAAEAGLHTGDRIVEVIGPTGAAAMSMEQIRSVFRTGPGAKVLLTVDRAGKRVQITLTLRRAI